MKVIDKAALVAEIKRRISNLDKLGNHLYIETNFPEQYRLIHGYESVLSFLDTLEVREVDLEKEITHYFKGWGNNEIHCFAMMQDGTSVGIDECIDIAKHFFELGLNASNPLTWKDIRKIDTLCCKVEMEHIPKEEEHYQEVLKRFKELKGE